jgi:ankyrin repeat protein
VTRTNSGSPPGGQTPEVVRAYFDAIRGGDFETLNRLLADDPSLLEARDAPADNPRLQLRCTGLHAAVHAARIDVARLLLDSGIDIDATTTEGRTALHDAIELGKRDIEQLLLERGARVDVCVAAILGRTDDLRRMLDRHPQLANDRSTELSPLGWAAYGNQCETARELIERGARMDDGELLCAASVGHVEVGRLLIDRGAEPDAIDQRAGGNALHAAVAMKYTHDSRPFVEMLLQRGVDLDVRTRHGQTALELAESLDDRQNRRLAEAPGVHSKPFAEIAEMIRRSSA